jgi:hypothetical protein
LVAGIGRKIGSPSQFQVILPDYFMPFPSAGFGYFVEGGLILLQKKAFIAVPKQ